MSDLQGPHFLSCPFQPPLRAVSCARGLLLWHGLANFPATGRNSSLCWGPLPPVVPLLQVRLQRQPPTGKPIQQLFPYLPNIYHIYAIASIYHIPVFTQLPCSWLHLRLLYSCHHFFSAAPLNLIIFVSLLCRLFANSLLDSRSSLICYLLSHSVTRLPPAY